MEMTSPPPDIHENPSDETLRLIRIYTAGALENLEKTRDFDRIADLIVNTLWTTFLRSGIIGKETLLSKFWSPMKLTEIKDALQSSGATPEIFLEECIIVEELYKEEYEPGEAAKIIIKMRDLENIKQIQSGFQRQVSGIIASTERPGSSSSSRKTTRLIPRPPQKKS